MAEMVSYLPISSPFIRFAGRYVDEAFGFAAGWNFFIFEAALVPFEVVACNVIIHCKQYQPWRSKAEDTNYYFFFRLVRCRASWRNHCHCASALPSVSYPLAYQGETTHRLTKKIASMFWPYSGMEKPSSGLRWAKSFLLLA